MLNADAVVKIFDRLMEIAKIPVWFLASTLVLLLYISKVNLFGFYDFMTANKIVPIIVLLICIFSFSCCLYDGVYKLVPWTKAMAAKRKLSAQAYNTLRYYLTDNQKRMLFVLMQASDYSYFFKKQPELDELEKIDIVRSSSITKVLPTSGGEIIEHRYTIQSWAYKFLIKRLRLLETDFTFVGFKNGAARFEHKETPTTTITFY